jgi:hypothetical protein
METLEQQTEKLINSLEAPSEIKAGLLAQLERDGVNEGLIGQLRGVLESLQASYLEEVKAWEQDLRRLEQQIGEDQKSINANLDKNQLDKIRQELENM